MDVKLLWFYNYRISWINSCAGYFLQAIVLLVARYSRARVKRGRVQFRWINLSMHGTKLNNISFGPGTL